MCPYSVSVCLIYCHYIVPVTQSNVDSEDEQGMNGEKEGWETIELEGQHVGIKTASIEEKCQAFEMLVIHCSTMGVKFSPWLSQVLELVLPGLTFIFHDGVREAAALCVVIFYVDGVVNKLYQSRLIPMLLVCGKKSNMLTPDMLNVVFNQLVNVIGAEDDPSFLASAYKCFTDSTRVVGKESLPTTVCDSIIKATQNQLQVLAQKRKRRSEKSTRELQEEREDVALLEEMEEFAFEEMGKMLQLFDESHPLLFAIGSLKELGIRTEQWDNEGD